MENCLFLTILRLLEEYAFRICETAITLTFIWVYGRMAIRHVLKIESRDRMPRALRFRRRRHIEVFRDNGSRPARRVVRRGTKRGYTHRDIPPFVSRPRGVPRTHCFQGNSGYFGLFASVARLIAISTLMRLLRPRPS
jgi:hypothetical protein